MIRRLIPAIGLFCALCSGCHAGKQSQQAQTAAPSYKVYRLRGKVVAGNPTTGEVTVAHEAIPGFMDAMTMPYKLKDPSILSELHPGDVFTADLLVSQDADADVLLGIFGFLAISPSEARRKLFMHINVTIGLVAFLGGAAEAVRGYMHAASAGLQPDMIALASKVTMAGLMLVYVVLCVRSFVAARRGGKV